MRLIGKSVYNFVTSVNSEREREREQAAHIFICALRHTTQHQIGIAHSTVQFSEYSHTFLPILINRPQFIVMVVVRLLVFPTHFASLFIQI